MDLSKVSAHLKKTAGVHGVGIERKTARIRNGAGKEVTDILGWDVIIRAEDGECYSYYEAQPPLIGLTQAEPIMCPLGIIPFITYKIDIAKAIEIFKGQNGGDIFVSIVLSKPLVNPPATEPFWYFRTNLGNTIVIGADSGHMIGTDPVPLYRAPVVLYSAPAILYKAPNC